METAISELEELLEFLREAKKTFKEVGNHQRKFAERCLKTVDRGRVLARQDMQDLLSFVGLFVKGLAANAQAMGNKLLGMHRELKSLVAIVKDTKKSLDLGIKQCSERLRSAKRAWDKAESSRQTDQTVFLTTDSLAKFKEAQKKSEALACADIADRWRQNYEAVLKETAKWQEDYRKNLEDLKEQGMISVSMALQNLGLKNAQTDTQQSFGKRDCQSRSRPPLLALPSRNSFLSSAGRLDSGNGSPHFSSNISHISKETIDTSPTAGRVKKVSDFLLSSLIRRPESPD